MHERYTFLEVSKIRKNDKFEWIDLWSSLMELASICAWASLEAVRTLPELIKLRDPDFRRRLALAQELKNQVGKKPLADILAQIEVDESTGKSK